MADPPRDLPPVKKGDRPSARWWTRLGELAGYADGLSVEAPIEMMAASGWKAIRLPTAGRPFYVRLTAYDAATKGYSWVEVLQTGPGPTWTNTPTARSGVKNAVESNLAADVPADPTTGSVVELRPGFAGQDYRFQWKRRGGGGTNTCKLGYSLRIVGIPCCGGSNAGMVIDVELRDPSGAVIYTGTYTGLFGLTIPLAGPGLYTLVTTPRYRGLLPATQVFNANCGGNTLGPGNAVDPNYVCCNGLIPHGPLNFTFGGYSCSLTYQELPVIGLTQPLIGWFGSFLATTIPPHTNTGPPCFCQLGGDDTNWCHVLLQCGHNGVSVDPTIPLLVRLVIQGGGPQVPPCPHGCVFDRPLWDKDPSTAIFTGSTGGYVPEWGSLARPTDAGNLTCVPVGGTGVIHFPNLGAAAGFGDADLTMTGVGASQAGLVTWPG